ncbi:MAG: AsmA family protein [Bacteroidales bacterium]|nr:AsmA family protein [Bacteroidales bacterium]
MQKFRKWVFRTFLAVALTGTVIVSVMVGYGYLKADDIKNFVIGELNQQLAVELEVGDIQFSTLSDFPKATVIFNDVRSKSKNNLQQKPLINAGTVAVSFNFQNLITGHYTIDKIRIDKAFLNLMVDADGNINYGIIETDGSQTNRRFTIDLHRVELEQAEISYFHEPSRQAYIFTVNTGNLSGTFSEAVNAIRFKGDIQTTSFSSGKYTFLQNRELALELHLELKDNNRTIQLIRGNASIDNIHFETTGQIVANEKNKSIDLRIKTGTASLDALFNMIPSHFLEPVKAYNMAGSIAMDAIISGSFSENTLPAISVDFGVTDATFSYPETNLTLRDVEMKGNFANGAKHSSQSFALRIDDFKAGIFKSEVEGNLFIENFTTPLVEVSLRSEIDLNDLAKIVVSDPTTHANGSMKIDLKFKNKLSGFRKFTIDDFISSSTQGRLEMTNASFGLKNSPLAFTHLNGQFRFNNKDLVIENFTGDVSDNDFDMKGHFGNLLAWAFLPNQPLYIDASVKSNRIDLDKLLARQDSEHETGQQLTFSGHVSYDLNIKIDHFKFRKFSADNMTGRLTQRNKILRLSSGHFSSMNGEVDIEGTINGNRKNEYTIQCSAQTKQVNIRKLFSYFGDFGQDNLTHDQLNGSVTANTTYSSNLTPDLHVDPASVVVSSDIKIDEGELIGYSPLYKLSGYIDKDELKHIRFEELTNRIEINNEVITIPHMAIASSSLDLELSGTHTFNNVIDYHVKLKLFDILNKNRKQENSTDLNGNFVKKDKENEPNLFLSLQGDVSDPSIKYDSRAVRDKIAGDFRQEKQVFKKVIKNEFGRKTDEVETKEIKPAEAEKDFVIGWDETESKKSEVVAPEAEKIQGKKNKPVKKQKDFIISWEEKKDTIR